MKQINYKKSQRGSLLIEAMAMLGLIAMVTPLLYKKAAERTTELQDINAAGEVRVVMNAVEDYLRDNYDDIVAKQTVTSKCDGSTQSMDFSFGNGDDENIEVPLKYFCEYLPYGFNEKTRSFNDLRVVVKKRTFDSGHRQDLTALLVATPTNGKDLQRMRASRIASMIGTNGGFAENKKAYGVQGVWEIDLSDFSASGFDPSKAIDNAIVSTSLQSIASGNHGRENVLHRVRMEEQPELNTMATTLNMGNYDVQDIKQLVVTGSKLDNKNEAILLKNGTGITVKDSGNIMVEGAGGETFKVEGASGNTTIQGTLDVTGNTTLKATLDVSGKGSFHDEVVVDKKLTADTATITNLLEAGLAHIAGELTVAGTSNLNGLTTIGTAVGTAGDPTDNIVLDVKGDAHFEEDVAVDGTIEVENLNVKKVFKAGLMDDGQYNMVTSKDSVDIFVNNFQIGAPTTGTTGFLVTETLTKLKNGTEINIESPRVVIGNETHEGMVIMDTDGVGINNGNFKINNADTTLFEVNQADKTVLVKGDADFIASSVADGNVLAIDTNHGAGTKPTGSIYVRKGVIEMERGVEADKADTSKYKGYIQLDRVVSNKDLEVDAFHKENTGVKYEDYQINPAYTSVMHDIKLTSRGGARLSDILPDFINKGIYVLDGTYEEKLNGKSVDWNTNDSGAPLHSAQFPYDINRIVSGGNVVDAVKAKSCKDKDFNCTTTPWLGFIPAPTCPPGYLKVATISPIRWAMAQAGRPTKSRRPGAMPKATTMVYNRDPNKVKIGTDATNSEPWRDALTFQQSTWLNTSLKALTKNNISYGWSGIIGFLYTAQDYGQYLVDIGEFPTINSIAVTDTVWNLFEVYNQEIVGIANVYCYFNRRSKQQLVEANSSKDPDFENDTLIDRYDQMTSLRTGYNQKAAEYVKRLNDPTMKYTDPW